jgi:hypothetical protein
MAEMVRWCEAHGSDWYRDWCMVIEMARREGHRVDDFVPCRPVEGVWSLPGELIDPANVDYDAATRVMRSWLVEDNDAPLLSAVRLAVDAALGVGEPVEGSG